MSTGLAPGLARKVSKTLEIKTESPDIFAALSTLSSFYQENTVPERKNLRAGIEGRAVSLNADYLASAEPLIQALESVQTSLDAVRDVCRQAKQAINHAQDSSSGLLSVTERHQRDLKANEKRTTMVQQFLEQYQLTSSEATALQAPELGEDFFNALDRVRSIHSNCKALLRTHHQRAGLELMDAMSSYQEAAFERLCRWVLSETKRLSNNDALELEPLLQRGAQALRDRPVLFKYCAREVATARHNALFQRFITALTKGGPGGMPRPIEMHAHDPKRYLGDMLAWVHQSLASEKEFLHSLFGSEEPSAADSTAVLRSSQEMDRLSSDGMREISGKDSLRTSFLLDRIFDSICRPLTVRVEQILIASPPMLLCFHLSQLLGFYTNLVDKLLGNDANLTQTLGSCRAMASRRFQDQLRQAGEKLLRYPPQPPRDLSVPAQFLEATQQTSSILTSLEASYDGEEGQAGVDEFAPVLAACLDPLLEAIHKSSQPLNPSSSNRLSKGPGSPAMQHEYIINCYSAVEHTLAGHPICAARLEEVQNKLQHHLTSLVRSHTGKLLVDTGMAEIVDRMRFYTNGKAEADAVMSQDPALPPAKVAAVLTAYIEQLSGEYTVPEFRGVQVPRLRTLAVNQVAATFSNAYSYVHDNLSNPDAGYKDDPEIDAVLRHSPEEIRTILGII